MIKMTVLSLNIKLTYLTHYKCKPFLLVILFGFTQL